MPIRKASGARESSVSRRIDSVSGILDTHSSQHSPWIQGLVQRSRPSWDKILRSAFFVELANGALPVSVLRYGLLNFYPLVESFPKYIALTLAKVPSGNNDKTDLIRNWLIENLAVERLHAKWFKQWAIDFGVPEREFEGRVVPPAGMDAVNNYLCTIAFQGSLAEAIGAINYAIEGPTGDWTKRVKRRIRTYIGTPDVTFRKGTLYWLSAHAAYDDVHPDEALSLINLTATTKDEKERVEVAAIRAMEYYAMAAESCYENAIRRSDGNVSTAR